MNRHRLKATFVTLFLAASLAISSTGDAAQKLILKGLNVTHSCLNALVQVQTGVTVPAQSIYWSCSQIPYHETETLIYDDATASCSSWSEFTSTTTSNIHDTSILYSSRSGSLESLLGGYFVQNHNAIIEYDPTTGLVAENVSAICAQAGPVPPLPPPPPGNLITKGAFLKASNTLSQNQFGSSLAVSGNTLVVGAPRENSDSSGVNGDETNSGATASGAVYVFVFAENEWQQQAYLKASNTDAGDTFGNAVAISGDTIVVGAREESSNARGVNADQDNNDVRDAGAAYVFVRDGTNWEQQAYLKASNTDFPSEAFGHSVAIDGDIIVVGADEEASRASGVNGDQTDNGSTSGAAYVFVRDGTSWSQDAYLKASNNNWDDPDNRRFGQSVAISGTTIVVGDYFEPSNATGVNGDELDRSASRAGAAFVFQHNGENWYQQAFLKASNTESFDNFAVSVAISDDTIVVGAWGEDSNGDQSDNSDNGAGAAYVFTRSRTIWSQQAYLKAANVMLDQAFGFSVSISGDALVVGANREDVSASGVNGNAFDQYGSAYLFRRDGAHWHETLYLKAANADKGDQFASSVAVGGAGIVVGAPWEDSDSKGIDGSGSNNLQANSGAAYVIMPHKEIVVEPAEEPPAPGTLVTITADGFKSTTLVQAYLLSEPILLGEEIADSNGEVTFQVRIPLEFTSGDHSFLLVGQNPDDSERRLASPITIESTGIIFGDGFE